MIDWNRPVEEVYNLVRGLSPVPASFTTLEKKKLKIYKGGKIIGKPSIEPGIIDTDGKNYLRFACIDGYIDILDLQLEGKKRMEVKDFLRGYRFGVDAK